MTHHQHPNVEVLRQVYDAFGAGDTEAMDVLLADDAVWHVPGNNQMSGDYKGKEQIFGFFARIGQTLGEDGSFEIEVHDILANDEHGVALVRPRGERAGKKVEGNAVQVYHLSGGKVTEFWGFPQDPAALDEFWS